MRKTKAKSKGKKPHNRKKILKGQKYTRMHIVIRKHFFYIVKEIYASLFKV